MNFAKLEQPRTTAFFPSTMKEWSKERDSDSFATSKSIFLKFIRSCVNTVFNSHNLEELKLITHVRHH